MLRSMYAGISGMKANQTKLDVIGNNIANASTTGFKSSSARFSDMFYQSSKSATTPTNAKGGTNASQVGLGAQLSSVNKVASQGNALSTGRSLDVCVDGDGYLIVSGGNTSFGNENKINGGTFAEDVSNEMLYTRDGNFTLDKDGNLLTSNGYRVMGYLCENTGSDSLNKPSIDENGVAYYVSPEALKSDGKTSALEAVGQGAQLNTLRIPNEVVVDKKGTTQPVSSFSIGSDGLITAVLGDGSLTALGQIAMATFKNPEGLIDQGQSLAIKSVNSGEPIIKTPIGQLANGLEDNSSSFGDIMQGCLEASNVDLTEQFTDMITATRSFQASSKMITTADEILKTITGLM